MMPQDVFSNLILSFGSFTHKKLQKLAYYIYCWHLVLIGERVSDLRFEAWVHGPVSPELYHRFKYYGWNSIPKYEGYLSINNRQYCLVKSIVNEYGKYDADELEEKTHIELPWRIARNGLKNNESSNNLINDLDIIHFYTGHPLYLEFKKALG